MHRPLALLAGPGMLVAAVAVLQCSGAHPGDVGGDAATRADTGSHFGTGSGTGSSHSRCGADASRDTGTISGDARGATGTGSGTGSGSSADGGSGSGSGSSSHDGGSGTGSGSGSGGPGTLALRNSGYLPGSPCDYGEYLPPGFTTGGNWPFLIFQHGIGQVGGTLSDAVYTTGGPMYELNTNAITMAEIPMVVLQPHVDGLCAFDTSTGMSDFVNAAMAYYGLDPKRFFITGLSEGGAGTNAYLNVYYTVAGAPVPAAAIPLAAAGEFNSSATAGRVVSDKIALWGGDSIDDAEYMYGSAITTDVFNETAGQFCGRFLLSTYPLPDSGAAPSTCYCDTTTSKYVWLPGMVTQIAGVDINPPYLLTLWPGSAHSASWAPFYSNPDVYRWLLAHPRS